MLQAILQEPDGASTRARRTAGSLSRLCCMLLLCLSATIAAASAKVEVTMMLPPSDRQRHAWTMLAEEFNRRSPDTTFRLIWSDLSKKFDFLSVAGQLPDLILIPDFDLVNHHEALIDLEPFFEARPELRLQIHPKLIRACHYKGRLKLLPLFYSVPIVYYRPDLFRKAGLLPPDPDWTWNDYRRAARLLTERNADGSVKTYGTNVQMGWWVEWLTLVRQAGGDVATADGTLQINQVATRQAFELMHDLIFADGSAPGLAENPPGGFMSGRIAIYYAGHVSELDSLRSQAPFEWDLATLPIGPAGRTTGELAAAGVGVSKTSKHSEAAMKVLDFILCKESAIALANAGLIPPARSDVARETMLLGSPESRQISPRHIEILPQTLEIAASVPKLRFFLPLAQSCLNPLMSAALRNPNRDALADLPVQLDVAARNYLRTLEEKPPANRSQFFVQSVLAALAGLGLLWWYFRRTPVRPRERTMQRLFLLFASPCVVGLLLLSIWPLLLSFWWAQTDYNLTGVPRYVGLEQYRSLLLSDPDFWHSLKLSLLFAVFAVPLGLAVSLGTALLLNQAVPAIGFFRSVFYLPSILPAAASAMMWVWFLDPHSGVVNRLFAAVGVQGPGWLQDPRWTLPAVVLISLWGFGGGMLIFLAGLKNISKDLYEAAEIDGAETLSLFFHITLPSLAPMLFFNLTIGIIGALQVFDLLFLISSFSNAGAALGGPEKSTYFYVLNLYEKSFVYLNVGVGSAMAWLFFMVILLITGANFWARRFWWQTEGGPS